MSETRLETCTSDKGVLMTQSLNASRMLASKKIHPVLYMEFFLPIFIHSVIFEYAHYVTGTFLGT